MIRRVIRAPKVVPYVYIILIHGYYSYRHHCIVLMSEDEIHYVCIKANDATVQTRRKS